MIPTGLDHESRSIETLMSTVVSECAAPARVARLGPGGPVGVNPAAYAAVLRFAGEALAVGRRDVRGSALRTAAYM